MNLTEFKYITPDIIQSGRITVFSPEMYKEAYQYNLRMQECKEAKKNYDVLYQSLLWANVLTIEGALVCLYFGSVYFGIPDPFQRIVFLVIYVVFFGSVVLWKRNFRPLISGAISAILLFADIWLIILAVFNVIICRKILKYYEWLKGEPGYPKFDSLRILCDRRM